VSRPIKAIFTQLGQLQKGLKDLAEKVATKPAPASKQTDAQVEVSEKVREMAKVIADKRKAKGDNIDPEGLAEIMQETLNLALELSPKEKAELPADIKEKLKLLDRYESETKSKDEGQLFSTEWDGLTPALKKEFPNAGEAELRQARELMDEIAHSKQGGVIIDAEKRILKPYPLDYLLHKNRDKFVAILKVAKAAKSGEKGGREMVDVEDEDEEIDLNPETMTPEKMKRREKQKLKAHTTDKVEIVGTD